MPKFRSATIGALRGLEDEIVRWRQQGYPMKRTSGKNGKPAKEGILDKLKANGIDATFAQIERVLRNQGERKYLHGSEWARILRRVDFYESIRAQCSVKVNGILYGKSKLQRKRRDYCKELRDLERREVEITDIDLPSCVEIQVEPLDIDETGTGGADAVGTTIAEDAEEVTGIQPQITSTSYTFQEEEPTLDPLETNDLVQQTYSPSTQNLTNTGSQLMLSPFTQQLMQDTEASINPSSADLNIEQFTLGSELLLTSTLDQVWGNISSGADSPTNLPNQTQPAFTSNVRHEAQGLGHDSSISTPMPSWNSNPCSLQIASQMFLDQGLTCLDGQNPLAFNFLGEILNTLPEQLLEAVTATLYQGMPFCQNNALSLSQSIESSLSSSLQSGKFSVSWLGSTAGLPIFNSALHRILIFSIENNFSGCSDASRGIVLKALRQDIQLQRGLKDFLSFSQVPENAKLNLAENLIEAAIEHCDTAAVTEILSLKLLEINSIVCNFEGRRYTAVELSARLRSYEITKALIAAKADINKTLEQKEYCAHGALENAIFRREDEEFHLHMGLVDMIIHAGAKMTRQTLGLALVWKQDELTGKILSEILPSQHQLGFHYSSTRLFNKKDIKMSFTSDDFARIWIKRMIESCSESGCDKCLEYRPRAIEFWIKVAMKKGLFDLVGLLLPYIDNYGPLLVKAVRFGLNDIALMLLRRGADVGHCKHRHFSMPPATPLGEAIRTRNKTLIRILKLHGAFDLITNDGDHLESALEAAAEAGDLFHLQTILEKFPNVNSERLGIALNTAIRKGDNNAFLFLLKKGASENSSTTRNTESTLYYAVKQRKETLVRKVLECNIHSDQESALDEALLWGNLAIIKDIVAITGINCSISRAVKAGDLTLVEFLVLNGARLDRIHGRIGTPLNAAIINKDKVMIQYLINSGSNPADTNAFKNALEDEQILQMLLGRFRRQYPRGKTGFGSEILRIAVTRGNIKLLDALLEAKFDINHFSCESGVILHNSLGDVISQNSENTLELAEKLLKAGADPDGIVMRLHPLFLEPYRPQHTALLQAIVKKNIDLVNYLITEGANVHRPARLGVKRTPLQRACEVGSTEIVDLLLDKGVSPNEPPAIREGGTSLQLCVIEGYIGIAERLLRAGADIHASPCEVNGRTALEGAAEHGRFNMLKLLWNAASPQGFQWEECKSAMRLAEENGHIGCRELINDFYNEYSQRRKLIT